MGEQIKKMKAKVIHKYETEANWNLSNYIPDVGETVFYDVDETHDYVRQKNGDGKKFVRDLPFTTTEKDLMGASDFDIVVASEEEFKKCVYMLHPNKNEDGSVDLTTRGEPNPDFDYRYILVRDIDFTENLGSSDLDLAVLQPSIRYIKFDNCQWHCRWYLSGEEPTELNSTTKPTEYKRASGELNVIIDGIYVTEQNVIDSIPTEDDPDRYYYIGLRNFERIENCFIHYPKDYALVEEFNEDGTSAGFRYTFKFNLQYFNTIQNCKATALWDGSNISGCRVSERIVRCKNCTNIIAEPIYRGGELYRVQMRESSNLSNIYGSPIIYTDCKAIDADTCSEYDVPKASEVDEFDLIITSMNDLATLPSNTTAKNVLVTGFTLSNKTTVPGFFDNTINTSNEPYFVKFIVPKNVKYLKFSKSFYYTLARVVIQGHPDCIIDGLPTITAPYNYTQCTALYDFKEVRNCYARGINTYDENNTIVENNLTVGISNVLMNAPNISTYPALASSYNYKKTRFINCDLSYIEYAESITNSRIITTTKIGVSPYIKNAETINGLKVYSIPTSQKFTLQNCSHVSNVNSNGYNIIYDSCSKIDAETCDNVPEELIKYATKELINDSIKDFVNTSKLKSSIEYDLIISSVDEFKALESNTTAVNVLVQNFGIYRANHVNGFFDNSASDYMYWTKFRIPANVKYIKFNNFKQQNSRVVIQGHEDCIIDGFPTVTSPYTAEKLYGNTVVLYNFKEVRNCHCTNVHQIDADGNYTFVPGVNGISNVILDMPYPAEEYSITISGEKVSIDTTDLAPDREEQNTKFVNCDLMCIKGASTIENCRVHMGRLVTDYIYKTSVPAISDADMISGLTIQHIASNSKLTIKNCKNILGINDNSYAIDYIDCSNIGATQEYVDEAAANAGKIKDVVATSNSGLKVTTNEGVAAIDWDEEVVFVFDGGGVEEEFIAKYSEGLKFTSNGNGTCSVSGIGTCTDVDLMIPPTSPDGDKVASIDQYAFDDCDTITSVTIPDSVTSIDNRAFAYCDALTSVTIPDSVTSIGSYAFFDCYSLTSVTIPDSVTSIGNFAFASCSALTSVTIPDSVTSIGDYAFSNCSALTNITIDENNLQYSSIDGNLFSKDKKTLIQYAIGKLDSSFVVLSSVTSIGARAFLGCSALTNINIPDSVTSIGEQAFRNCSSLASVTIPDSVTSIGESMFTNCSSLASVTIGNSVTSIGARAFTDCVVLTSVTIPESVTSIGDGAFYNCTSLASVTIQNAAVIGASAFNNCHSSLYTEYELGRYVGDAENPYAILIGVTNKNLSTYKMHEDTKIIAFSVFSRCASMTSIEIPDGVKVISSYAFYYCDSLENIAYNGTTAQWKSISFGADWNNAAPATYVQCTDGTVAL